MSERRRQYYTDQKLQGNLLGVLIVVQVLLVSVLLFFLYGDINTLIEQHIYRIHSKGAESWPEIFRLLAITMSAFLVINIFLLYLAHTVWGRYIKGIISQFSTLLDHIVQRDFSEAAPTGNNAHQTMQLAQQWFNKERQRNNEINILLERLSGYKNKDLDDGDREQVIKTLRDYRQLLNVS